MKKKGCALLAFGLAGTKTFPVMPGVRSAREEPVLVGTVIRSSVGRVSNVCE